MATPSSDPQSSHRHVAASRTGADNASDSGTLLYTPAEAARRLQVPESWLRRKAAARTVPCTFLGKHLRFSPTDLTAIIAAAAKPATGRRRPRRRTPTAVRERDLPPAAD